jgi:hypothetical protein
MGKTFTQLKDSVNAWLNVTVVRLPDTDIGDIINLVKAEFMRKYELSFGETSDTFNTVVGTNSYALPTGFSKAYSMWYLRPSDSQVQFLNGPLTKEEFDARYPDPTTQGDPLDYCIWGGYIYLGYNPDAIVTMHRNYYKILADFSSGSDHDAFSDNAWPLLLYASLVEASRYLIEDPRIPMWEAKARQLERQLVTADSRARSIGRAAQANEPGTITPYPGWYNPFATSP